MQENVSYFTVKHIYITMAVITVTAVVSTKYITNCNSCIAYLVFNGLVNNCVIITSGICLEGNTGFVV